MACDWIEETPPEVIEAGFLIVVFGGIAERATIGFGASCVDDFAEGAVGVFGLEGASGVGQSDEVAGAVVEWVEVGGEFASDFTDEEKAACSSGVSSGDVRSPEVFAF